MAVTRPNTAVALLVALLGAAGYAAFAEGAVGQPEEGWLQVGVALIALLAVAAWLGARRLTASPSPAALLGIGLLALYVAWAIASLTWSVTPDRTWAEVNRGMTYVLVVAIALLAAGAPRAIERVAMGWLAIAVAVAVYALGGKVAPGVLDHAADIARLRAPLEYWNALGLVCVLGVPVALRVATEESRTGLARVGGLLAVVLFLVTLGLTYSRGGIVALVVAMIVLTAAGGPRLRGLAAFGVACVAAAPALALGWTDDALTDNGVALEERIDAGLLLGGALLAGAILAAGAWLLFMREEPRVRWTRSRSQTTWFTLAAILLALIAGGITTLAASDRGLQGSLENAVDDFTEVRQDKVYEPDRLLSTTSANRWAWWQEAFGAFADEPFTGWGAGSFPVSRRLYRVSPLEVQQPHSLPLQFAAETGTLGVMLGLGGLIALFAAAVARVAEMRHGRERDLAIALLAAGAAWSVHALADWDWDIPGVTLPVFLFLGVIAGRRPREHGRRGAWPQPTLARWAAGDRPAAAGTGRWLVLGAACLALAAFVASAVLPAWSDSKTDEALRAVADRAPERLEDGAAAAQLAADLDPLAERPLFAAASIAEARDRALEAREHLLEAVDRAPWSAEAWKRLARIALGLADREGARAAALRLLALDPGNPDVIAFAQRAQGLLTPPEASGTAVGTPLTPGENATPAPEEPTPESPEPEPPAPSPEPPAPQPP